MSEVLDRCRSLGERNCEMFRDVDVVKSILLLLPSSFPLVIMSSTVALTFFPRSFVPYHLRAAIAIVEIVTEPYHPTCTGIIGADPPRITPSSTADCLHAFGAS